MGTIHIFRPRSASSAPTAASPAETRRLIEEATQAALDTADHLLAILDTIGSDPDCEDGGDAEPDLGAPEGHASQLVWLRGGDRDLELATQQEHNR